MRRPFKLAAIIACVFVVSAQEDRCPKDGDGAGANANTRSGTVTKTIWSGHWWPMHGTGPKLYDPGQAMETYWQYILATRDPALMAGQPHALTLESNKNICAASCTTCGDGHCHALSAASLTEPEPVEPITKLIIKQLDENGGVLLIPGEELPSPAEFARVLMPGADKIDTTVVTFHVRHQKGLLTELWFRSDFDFHIGDANNLSGFMTGIPVRITPRQFHEALAKIPAGLAMDRDPSDAVWEHPVHSYTTTWTEQRNGNTISRTYTTTLTIAGFADPDAVGINSQRLNYSYVLDETAGQPVGDGTWSPGTVRPGSMWSPKAGSDRSGNRQVTRACVNEILNRAEKVIVIRSTMDYKPWPCS